MTLDGSMDPMDQPLIPLERLNEGQLRDLILQAFSLLALKEGMSLLDVVYECYQEVRQETSEHADSAELN